MAKARKREGVGDPEYAAYVAAFERLLAQDPEDNRLEHPALREQLEEQRHVPVTQESVAMEAGDLSRKPLTGGGRFKELGARIKSCRSTHGVSPTTGAQLTRLRTDLDEATQTIVVLRSKVAEATIRADRATLDAKEQRAQVGRLRQQIAGRRG